MPVNIKMAEADDWGTCLFSYCLKPELKVEALNGLNLLSLVRLKNNIFEDKLSDFLAN